MPASMAGTGARCLPVCEAWALVGHGQVCSLAHLLIHSMFRLWYVHSLICLFGCSCIGSYVCKLFTCLFMRLPVRSFPLRSVANLVMPCPCEDNVPGRHLWAHL